MKLIKYILLLIVLSATTIVQAQIEVRAATIEVAADTIVVPIFMDNANNVASLSLTLDFDNNALSFIDFENTATFAGGMIANVVNGKLLVAWFALNPVTTATDTLVKLKFVRGSGCFSYMNWDVSSPGACQITDITGTTLPTTYTDGLVSFLIQDSPDLISPANISQGVFPYSTLQWTSAECFVNYRLQVATDTLFTNPTLDTLVQDTSFIPSNLLQNQIYHWRVAKVDTRDSLFWSDTWTFTTGGLASIQPKLPVIKAFADTIVVPVVVDSLFDVTNFDLVLNYDSSQTDLINVSNISTLSSLIINTTNGQVMFDYDANTGTSLVSDTLAKLTFVQTGCETTLTWDTTNANSKFTYLGIFDLPTIYTDGEIGFLDNSSANLIAPLDNATQVFFQPNLTWNSEECVQDFQLQLALDANFTNILIDTLLGNDTTFQVQNLADTTTYFWRVARIDLENSVYWSPNWQFKTEEVVIVQTIAHSAATYGDTLFIPITMDSLQDAAAFELYLDYDTTVLNYIDFSDTTTLISGLSIQTVNGQIAITWSSEDSTVNTAGFIPSDTLVQLRFEKVGGCYSDLTWNAATHLTHIIPNINLFSNNQNGLASFLVFDQPTALSPNNTTTLIYPELTWTSAQCAVNYQVQIATDSNFANVVLDSVLTDFSLIPTDLQVNTQYYWRALKLDTEGDAFASDTLSFTTGDAYNSAFTIADVVSEQNNITIPVYMDSLFWLTGLHLEIAFDTAQVAFTGSSNPYFTNLNVSESDGVITLDWSDVMPVDIASDTLIELHFDNKTACLTDLSWNTTTTNLQYYADGIQVPIGQESGSLNFINTAAVNLFLPPDNSITTSETPTLTWRSEHCTDEYQIQIAEDTFFNTIVIDQSGVLDTFYAVTNNLQSGITYFWRIARTDNLDSLYWSDIWRFKVSGVSTEEIAIQELDLKLYPNPFNDFLILETELEADDEFLHITFYDLNGQLIQEERIKQIGNIRTTLNTSNLNSGIHIIRIQTKNRVKTVKLVK